MTEVNWSKYALQYDEIVSNHPPYQQLLAHCLDVICSWPAGSEQESVVADLGAGTGNFSTAWAQARPDLSVLHVELDPGMNQRALEKARRLSLDNWEIVELDLNNAVWELPALNGVLTVNALYTLRDPKRAIDNIARALAPGGYVLATDIGRVINMLDWVLYLFRESVKANGLLKTVKLLRRNSLARRINHQIAAKQKSGEYWTHELHEFEGLFEQTGIEIISKSAQYYRGINDLVVGKKGIHQSGSSSEGLESRTLTTDTELEEFVTRFADFVADLPLSYLRQGTVSGFFNGETLVGGFAVITNSPFRLFSVIPERYRKQLDFLKSAAESELLEINGLWFDSRKQAQPPRVFWLKLANQILMSGKTYMLLGYNADRADLERLYNRMLTKVTPLYEGPAALEGTFPNWKIGYMKIDKMRSRWQKVADRTEFKFGSNDQ
ncbi:MAG: methyltransferase [Planctomycetota bacterium]